MILTLDKDFWQLALQRSIPLQGVILLRVYPAIPETLTSLVESPLRTRYEWAGRLSIVTKDAKARQYLQRLSLHCERRIYPVTLLSNHPA